MPEFIPTFIMLFLVALCVYLSMVVNNLKVRLKIRRAIVGILYAFAFTTMCAACIMSNFLSLGEIVHRYLLLDSESVKLYVQYVVGSEYMYMFKILGAFVVFVLGVVPYFVVRGIVCQTLDRKSIGALAAIKLNESVRAVRTFMLSLKTFQLFSLTSRLNS